MKTLLWQQVLRELFGEGRPAARPKRGLRPGLERLENRLTPAVIVSFRSGILGITGDAAANNISLVRQADGRLTVRSTNSQVQFSDPTQPTVGNITSIRIDGGNGDDTISLVETGGPLPGVTIRGGAGDDVITGGSGGDIIGGGDDDDFIIALAGDDHVFGGAGDDVVRGGTGSDRLDGGLDNDTLSGEAGDDVIAGKEGNDSLTGGTGDDSLDGGADNDVLVGAAGNDTLDGGSGDDRLFGGAGNDTQRGGLGTDRYFFDGDIAEGADTLVEAAGLGSDGLDFAATTTVSLAVDLSKTTAQVVTTNLTLTLSAGNTFENAVGGAKDDTLTGNTLANAFAGLAGKDTFVHRGSGDGIDRVTDMSSAQNDLVSFVTGGALSAADLTIDATAKHLRDAAAGTFGFDFTAAVLAPSSTYNFGQTDTATPGLLTTFIGSGGAGGFSAGFFDSLLATYNTNGATIGGAAPRQRILDFSANGNTLVGREGADILDGGAGNDNIQGDAGVSNASGNDILTGGSGGDSFFFGQDFFVNNIPPVAFGDDTVTDFGDGADTIKLQTGLSVRSGLGTTTVTIWNGATNFGTIFASNGHLWVAGDFT